MTYNQAKNKQQQESDKRNCVQVKFKFTKSTDADILEWLSAQDNKQGAIKRLIREDTMKAAKIDAVLDKIRDEIMRLDDINPDYPMDRMVHINRREVLEIIGKYKAGSEGER